jgi:nucleoside-diphosphate-sugar epimerase
MDKLSNQDDSAMTDRRPAAAQSVPTSDVRLNARRVLITGASGFIGGRLTEWLAHHGVEVSGLVRAKSARDRLQLPRIKLCQGDVTDRDSLRAAVADVDVVFHLAGVIKALDYEGYRRVNEDGVKNVLEACAERTTPPTVVVVSSIAAAGPAVNNEQPKCEHDACTPVSRYGRSKRAGELVAEQWADRLPITVVRPAIIFGEHDPAMLPLFWPIRRFGVHVVPGLKLSRLSMLHVDDLVPLMLAAAERGQRLAPTGSPGVSSAQGYYFAAGDEAPTMRELGRLIGRAMSQRRTWIIPMPEFCGWIVGGGNELWSQIRRQPSIVNLDKIREATAGPWLCSTQRAQQELGHRVETPLVERLRQTAEFYFKAGWLR